MEKIAAFKAAHISALRQWYFDLNEVLLSHFNDCNPLSNKKKIKLNNEI